MKRIIPATLLILLSASACIENATDAAFQPSAEPIRVSGALNTIFESSQSVLDQKLAEDIKLLKFSIHSATDQDNFWQRTSFTFTIKIEASQDLVGGQNLEFSDQAVSDRINYRSCWDESTYTDLIFEIDGGEIRIDSINKEFITGKFKLWAHQAAGRRMTHGQVEDLVLSNEGEITVSGVFSVANK